MQIAYLISAHTDAPQLARLVGALHTGAHYFIHIDAKSDIQPFLHHVHGHNIHFVAERHDVVWGTLVEVEYQLTLLRAAVAFPVEFDHIFFLSGMDYPLWSPERITSWLAEHRGKEILQAYCMDHAELQDSQRQMYTVPRPFSRCRRWAILLRIMGRLVGRRKELTLRVETDTWKLYKGSAWWCITEPLARHIIHTYDHKPDIRRYFCNSFGPAETLIPTIAFNTPRFAPHCMRYPQGPYPGLAALTPLHFIDYHPTIRILTLEDLPRLQASGKMFCRKIVSGQSDTLVSALSAI